MKTVLTRHKSIDKFNWFTERFTRLKIAYKVLKSKHLILISVDRNSKGEIELDIHNQRVSNRNASIALGAVKQMVDERIAHDRSVERQLNEIFNGNA